MERKLSQMILDSKFAGTLDQGAGHLVVYEDAKADGTYGAMLAAVANLDKVVDVLVAKSAKVVA